MFFFQNCQKFRQLIAPPHFNGYSIYMKHSLLCIDDDDINLQAFQRIFSKQYRVVTTPSANEALELIKEQTFSVILSDQNMPEMDGISFFKQSIQRQPDATRILLTGHADLKSVLLAINDGQVFRYLTKPFDFEDLKHAVAQGVEQFELKKSLEQKNHQLTQALEELRTLDKAKNQFMILVNHELKTPLTGLLSFLELLQETGLNEEQLKYSGHIEKNARRLEGMIAEILELISAQMNVRPLHLSQQSTQSLLSQTVDRFKENAQLKKLDFNIEDENLSFQGDQLAIQKVLNNLLENSVKIANENSTISLKTFKNEEGRVVFRIENEAPRISGQEIERLKKPFNIKEDIMNHSSGLGLGLSLSEALLQQHESALNISSDEKNTSIQFDLPADVTSKKQNDNEQT